MYVFHDSCPLSVISKNHMFTQLIIFFPYVQHTVSVTTDYDQQAPVVRAIDNESN